MGVEFFTCDFCSEISNDCCEAETITVKMTDLSDEECDYYNLCDECFATFSEKTGAIKITSTDYLATHRYFSFVINILRSKMTSIQTKMEDLKKKERSLQKNHENHPDQSSKRKSITFQISSKKQKKNI